MYTKQQASELRQEFWTAFGQYMSPQLSADGLKINWINYKTGVPGINFKMEADTASASLAIALSQADKGIQELYFEQFIELKHLLHGQLEEEWNWQQLIVDEHGKTVSRIYKQMDGVNVLNRQNWPDIITFFKPRIIALDEFWSTAKYTFDELRF